jgi:hypothetical protein
VELHAHARTFSGVWLVAAIGEQREGAACKKKLRDRELMKEIFLPAAAEAIAVYGIMPIPKHTVALQTSCGSPNVFFAFCGTHHFEF